MPLLSFIFHGFLYKRSYDSFDIRSLSVLYRPYYNLIRPGFDYLIVSKIDRYMDHYSGAVLIEDQIAPLSLTIWYMLKLR